MVPGLFSVNSPDRDGALKALKFLHAYMWLLLGVHTTCLYAGVGELTVETCLDFSLSFALLSFKYFKSGDAVLYRVHASLSTYVL